MRRWVFAFLLLVVPFQLVWGSAAPYCAHEASVSAKKHFGHHEHKHQAGGEVTPTSDNQGDGAGAYHADCESCHLGCSAAVQANVPGIQALPQARAPGCREPRFTSYVPSAPQRPDRVFPAPAARSGSGVVV